MRLQTGRISFRVVHEETGIDAEEFREKIARRLRQMRPRSALDLRQVRLTQSAADLALHRSDQLELRHGATQAAQRTFHRPQGTKFVT